ncbi:undecaprenyl-diphosphate phosphatase [Candidatus Nomurabacteria bacterium]|nr:undecaprenyl-diphosphate phosphatase [Candidatus Nomurabacteria bacterium]
MNILHSIILGVVEGVTEFLPISSTGHMILVGNLLNIENSLFTKSFEIIIQLGAIFSVVFLYWKKLWNLENIKKLIVAFIPTGVIGLVFYKIAKTYLLGNSMVVLFSLFIGGIIFIFFEKWYQKKQKKDFIESVDVITYKQSFIIGIFQSIAIIPGVSRSAASIFGGLSLGLNRATIVEFSFLLAVPTMLAASGLDILKNHSSFTFDKIGFLLIGFVVAFITALFSIKFLLKYIKNNNFIVFGLYRIFIAIVFYFLLFK